MSRMNLVAASASCSGPGSGGECVSGGGLQGCENFLKSLLLFRTICLSVPQSLSVNEGNVIADFYCCLRISRVRSDVAKCTVHSLLYDNTHSQLHRVYSFGHLEAKDQVEDHFLAGRSSAEL